MFTKTSRPIAIAATTLAIVLLAEVAERVAVSAQAGPQNGPSTGNQKTIPITVTQRAYDNKLLLSSLPVLSEVATTGRALWQQRCAFCHDGMGQATYKTPGPWMDSDTVEELGPEPLKMVISNGTGGMPAFRYDLNAQQIVDVIEFLKTVSPTLKPTAAQLAGKSPEGNGSE